MGLEASTFQLSCCVGGILGRAYILLEAEHAGQGISNRNMSESQNMR